MSGGTVTTPGDGYKYHTFTSSGTLTVTNPGVIEYCVVGGGGAGGYNLGGGGGGGRVLTGNIWLGSTQTITVGSAGVAATRIMGGTSQIGTIVRARGGGGGAANGGLAPQIGGNGGGGTRSSGAGAWGIDFNGGTGASGLTGATAGGGGAGANGASAPSTVIGGNGGNGVEWPASSGTFYGGGGGGWGSTTAGAGGIGGGGVGAGTGGTGTNAGGAATANTGGGGGGAGTASGLGGAGGSGIVIIRYLLSAVSTSQSTPPLFPLLSEYSSITNTNLDGAEYVTKWGTDYAVVACGSSDRCTVVNISNPASMTVTGSVQDVSALDNCYSVAVNGNYAYLGGGSNHFAVVDLTTPSTPTVSGSFLDTNFSVNGDMAIISPTHVASIAINDDRFFTLDVTTPTAPVQHSVATTAINGTLCVIGTRAWVYVNGSIRNIDISSPNTPVIGSGSYATTSVGWIRQWRTNYILALHATFLEVIDISSPTSPTLVATSETFVTGVSFDSLTVRGDYAYVVDNGGTTIMIVDLSPALTAGSPFVHDAFVMANAAARTVETYGTDYVLTVTTGTDRINMLTIT